MDIYVATLALLIKLCSSFNVSRHFLKGASAPLARRFANTLESPSRDVPSEFASFLGNKVIIDDSNSSASVLGLLDSKLLGFDLEYVPDYYAKIDGSYKKCKPSIVQVCSDSTCLIYLIYKIGHVPESLCHILDSSELLKVSHGAPSDMRLLFRHYGTQCRNFVDLKELCRQNNILPASLKHATESVLNKKLCKKQQCSNWEAEELIPEQISYASTDAWVTREIFLKLRPCKISKLFVNSEGDIETESPDSAKSPHSYATCSLGC